MEFDAAEFRRVLGHWSSGVSVVAAQPPEGAPCGLTVNAFCSVSLQPPLILVCVDKSADSHDGIARAGAFSVNVLADTQERLARHFAADGMGGKFAGVAYHAERTGAPILDGVLAWVDCRTWSAQDAGDHTVYIGEVLAADARDCTPLIYYRSGFGRFTP